MRIALLEDDEQEKEQFLVANAGEIRPHRPDHKASASGCERPPHPEI
jgi:hypothetical protein